MCLLFRNVFGFVFIAGAIFVLAVFVVPDVVTSATPLAVPARFARVAVITTGAVRTFDAFLTTIAIIASLAVCAVCAVLAVRAVHAVHAVDVAILIDDEIIVGGNGICHGLFSFKLVGVALPN